MGDVYIRCALVLNYRLWITFNDWYCADQRCYGLLICKKAIVEWIIFNRHIQTRKIILALHTRYTSDIRLKKYMELINVAIWSFASNNAAYFQFKIIIIQQNKILDFYAFRLHRKCVPTCIFQIELPIFLLICIANTNLRLPPRINLTSKTSPFWIIAIFVEKLTAVGYCNYISEKSTGLNF